jgi:hypothetical protein
MLLLAAVLVVAAACTSTTRSSPPSAARLLSAVSPVPSGCGLGSTCTPASAAGVAMAALPQGFGPAGGATTDQLDDHDVMITRTWQVSRPAFLNPGGEPMGATITVQVTNHPAEDERDALGLDSNPRPPSPVQVGARSAYSSTWTISTYALDGTTPVQLAAASIYVALSDTVRVQVNTIGLDPTLTQLLAAAVVVQ